MLSGSTQQFWLGCVLLAVLAVSTQSNHSQANAISLKLHSGGSLPQKSESKQQIETRQILSYWGVSDPEIAEMLSVRRGSGQLGKENAGQRDKTITGSINKLKYLCMKDYLRRRTGVSEHRVEIPINSEGGNGLLSEFGAKKVYKLSDIMSKIKAAKGTIKGYDQNKENLIKGKTNQVFGKGNKVSGEKNAVLGNKNDVYGTSNGVEGHRNQVRGANNVVKGKKNMIKGHGNTVQGEGNVVIGAGSAPSRNALNGNGNYVKGFGNYVRGHGNTIG